MHLSNKFLIQFLHQDAGEQLISTSQLDPEEIRQRLSKLESLWQELQDMAKLREERLAQSVIYQQFLAKVDEEEAWIAEKGNLMKVTDVGASMAAVQVIYSPNEAQHSSSTQSKPKARWLRLVHGC